jgi:nucleotide-binding universal stress UspA family protein
VAEGILDTAHEEAVDLILLGWRGYSRSFGASMGPIIDRVIRDAERDVTVVKGDEWSEARKILVPTAGGPHAPIAAHLAMTLADTYGSWGGPPRARWRRAGSGSRARSRASTSNTRRSSG